jgi:hypothetical protein
MAKDFGKNNRGTSQCCQPATKSLKPVEQTIIRTSETSPDAVLCIRKSRWNQPAAIEGRSIAVQ